MDSARTVGAVPDFSKLHREQERRLALAKSNSAKTLTEFREFRLTASKRAAAASSTAASAQAPAPTFTPQKAPSQTTQAKAIKEQTTPRPQSVASQLPRQTLGNGKPTSATKRRVIPPVPTFDAPPPAVAVAPIAPPAGPAAAAATVTLTEAISAVPLIAAAPCSLLAPVAAPSFTDGDDSFEFDDSDFAVDGASVSNILNDDAWREEDDCVVPLPCSTPSTNEPFTPRRSTLSGATAANLLTPRSANRGSIHGGALRTATRPNFIRTPAARMTISGALPGLASHAPAAVPSSPAIRSMHQMKLAAAAARIGKPQEDLAGTPARTVSARTPAKPRGNGGNGGVPSFMSPTAASRQQQQTSTPTRTYVAV